jgi:hypothetical protein
MAKYRQCKCASKIADYSNIHIIVENLRLLLWNALVSEYGKGREKMTKLNSNAAKIWTKAATVGAMVFVAVQLSGCAGIGPPTVDRDRFDYVSAISESWKRQTLLNLLKTRYLDAPVFMDVSSVINQYALEGEIELGFTWSGSNTQSLGGTGKYTDRPTITYNPVMGKNFAQSLLRPIPIPRHPDP